MCDTILCVHCKVIYSLSLFCVVVRGPGEPTVVGDIAVDVENGRNADPCTSIGCKWPKYSDGLVYVPYVIANHFSMSLTLPELVIHTRQ